MSRQILELEAVLQQMIVEHQKLFGFLATQQHAMKHCNLKIIDDLTNQQEACRLRIAGLEQRRRLLVGQIGTLMKINGELSLRKIAELHPLRAEALLKLRTDLKNIIEQVRTRAFVAGRVANAVLGHLNTVVRLVAGAVEKAGLYTKRGVPRVSNRIGVMEAIG